MSMPQFDGTPRRIFMRHLCRESDGSPITALGADDFIVLAAFDATGKVIASGPATPLASQPGAWHLDIATPCPGAVLQILAVVAVDGITSQWESTIRTTGPAPVLDITMPEGPP